MKEPELIIQVVEENGEYYADIHSCSDIRITLALYGYRGHGKTKEEAIQDFKNNIYKLDYEVSRVQGRLVSDIYKLYEAGDY